MKKSTVFRVAVVLYALMCSRMSAVAQPTEPPAPARIDITKVTCRDLIAANPLDRAAVVMFYWGYAAAKANVSSFKTGVLRTATEHLMTQCRAQPSQTLMGTMSSIDIKAF